MTNTITFRNATLEEASTLALVNARAYASRDGKPLPIEAKDTDILDFEDRMTRPGVWTRVATTGGRVVGFALGYPRIVDEADNTTPDTEYLSLLAVDPDFHGHRAASHLLDLVSSEARQNGRRHLSLWTNKLDNDHARSIYEHKGFVLTGEARPSQYGHQIEYQQDL